MKVWFEEEFTQEIHVNGNTLMAGGLRIDTVNKMSDFSIADEYFCQDDENKVNPENLRIGQVVAMRTEQYNKFPHPFIVTDKESKDDTEDEDLDELIWLGYSGPDSITEGIVLTKGKLTHTNGFSATYYENEGSFFVSNEAFTAYLLPDMHLANYLGQSVKEKLLPYSI